MRNDLISDIVNSSHRLIYAWEDYIAARIGAAVNPMHKFEEIDRWRNLREKMEHHKGLIDEYNTY